jgi:hypothetical protein
MAAAHLLVMGGRSVRFDVVATVTIELACLTWVTLLGSAVTADMAAAAAGMAAAVAATGTICIQLTIVTFAAATSATTTMITAAARGMFTGGQPRIFCTAWWRWRSTI